MKKVAIFFDDLVPFYKNPLGNEISCSKSGSDPSLVFEKSCFYFPSTSSSRLNFMHQDRIEFILGDFTSSFSVIFPVAIKKKLATATEFSAYDFIFTLAAYSDHSIYSSFSP